MLHAYQFDNGGYIYTPVSLNALVMVDFDIDYLAGQKKVYRWDLSADIPYTSWYIFGGTLSVGKLNIRGSDQALPNISNYVGDPSTVVVGRNWTGTKSYNNVSGSSYGEAVYIVSPNSGYQLNTTSRVDFEW